MADEQEVRKTKPFVHLHLHSEYSLLDGAARITKGKKSPLLTACLDKQMPGCALTDHGNMFGAFTFYKTARQKGVKPIIGCEFYVCDDMHKEDKKRYHLVLLAKTTEGYRNIVKMDSLAYVEGFYYKPRIDIELLKQHTKGVICLSGCLSGTISSYLVQGDYESAKQYALMLKSMFDEGDFYIEIQDHGIAEEKKINPLLVKLAREIGVKVVATNDVHYIEQTDAEMHDTLLCIQTGKKLDDVDRMRFDSDQFYLKDYDEMMELFSWCPEAVTNTVEVMEKCNIEIKKQDLMPPYKPDDGSTPEQYLRNLAYDGLKKRYGEPLRPDIVERAEYELGIIHRMGFDEYYLIVWDFINYARQQGIPVGAGRGSGVGSIIAYAIHITNVDPLRYNLLFERFLNPERVSAPDFDVDFCMDRRGEVIDYVIRRYGKEKVCQILALGTMKAKGAIKDVARVMDVSLDKVNKTTKAIPNTPGLTLDMVLGRVSVDDIKDPEEREKKRAELEASKCPEVIEMYENDDEMRRVIDMALKIEGMPRNCSKHAAGVVICKEVISDYVPLQRNGNDITTQFQKDEVEELGMLKMDFLGLTTLTDLSKAKQYIKENYGIEIDFEKLGYEDPEVYKLISSGETDAVFQLESAGMKKFMMDLQPECLEDIIAGISLFRPGPIDSIPTYVRAKHNPETITYDHPLLEPILNMTYGCLVYQEQVMQVVQQLAGYTLGRADILRRAMGKKKVDVMKKEKDIFINGCPEKQEKRNELGEIVQKHELAVDGAVKRGVPAEIASKIFDDMESFAKYAFNKSHAAAYAVLAYETGYIKRYYLVELVAAVINNRITKADEIAKYLTFLREKGKQVLQPDINKSDYIFRAKDDAVRFGLCGIKNVGQAAMEVLVKERQQNGEFKSIGDMLNRLPAGTINKRMFEALIKGGAFDCFGHTRASLLACYENLLATYNNTKKKHCDGQMSLFDLLGDDSALQDDIPEIKELDSRQKYAYEKEVLNIYMTGHPLEQYRQAFEQFEFNLSLIAPLLTAAGDEEDSEEGVIDERAELAAKYSDKEVILGGMLNHFKKSVTKKGKLMAYGELEDLYGSIELVFFPAVLAKYSNSLQDDKIVKIRGRINTVGDRVSIVVSDVSDWENDGFVSKPSATDDEEKRQEKSQRVYVKISDMSQLAAIKAVCRNAPGKAETFVQFEKTLYKLEEKIACRTNVVNQIKAIVGAENIIIKE
ncbi:MAG: DNA polymerase III subunit alpha [Eubacteriales bacterium]|nr:DNA polymerase III subunit alpha [Eubacteriales bacterium]